MDSKLEPMVLDGVVHDREALDVLRNDIITVRDKALEEGVMKWAVVLSHVIAALGYLRDNTKES